MAAQLSQSNLLKDRFPELLIEIADPSTNLEKLTYGSGQKILWRCSKNSSHTWKASPNSRTGGNSGCPKCHPGPTSRIEQIIVEHLENVFDQPSRNRYPFPGLMRKHVDFYSKAQRVVVEYDGGPWHRDSELVENDLMRNAVLESQGIIVIRLRDELPKLRGHDLVLSRSQTQALYHPQRSVAILDLIVKHIFEVLEIRDNGGAPQ